MDFLRNLAAARMWRWFAQRVKYIPARLAQRLCQDNKNQIRVITRYFPASMSCAGFDAWFSRTGLSEFAENSAWKWRAALDATFPRPKRQRV